MMNPNLLGLLSITVTTFACTGLLADEAKWRPLFNGKDLSGWQRVNCAPDTFTVRDNMIVSTGVPTGVLRSDRHYENFELELEWRHMKPKGNAGLFVWSGPYPVTGKPFTKSIEVQILDGRNTANYTSHGDVFAIQGATMKPDRPHPGGWTTRCLPSERRCKPSPEWNHYRVVCNDGRVQLAVNGKVVSGGSECNPRKGYICLEAEGSECHFRNIRIRELPSSNTPPELTAPLASDFRSLYTGVDLSGWKIDPEHTGHWVAKDWTLDYDGKSEAKDKSLWTTEEFGDFVLTVDWRLTGKPTRRAHSDGSEKKIEILDAGASAILLRGGKGREIGIDCSPSGSGTVRGAATRPIAAPERRADRRAGKWNRFVITMIGDRVGVELNGVRVIEDTQLSGVPERGPIGLKPRGSAIQFANLLIRELD